MFVLVAIAGTLVFMPIGGQPLALEVAHKIHLLWNPQLDTKPRQQGSLGHRASDEPSGALNPQVNQTNIRDTICKPGWTKTVRPPAKYTDQLKVQQMSARSLSGRPHDYEEDHFIPLELGGNPTDPNNLWPQPWPEARLKDHVENLLHMEVCIGSLSLQEAQERIRSWHDWLAKEN